MPRRGPDLTNRERQARHRGRRKAILAALAAPVGAGPADAPDASPAPVDPDRLEPQDVKSALRKLSRIDRLASAEAGRAAFTAEVAPAAGEIGRKLVQMGLQGDVGALIAAARAVAPRPVTIAVSGSTCRR